MTFSDVCVCLCFLVLRCNQIMYVNKCDGDLGEFRLFFFVFGVRDVLIFDSSQYRLCFNE